MTLLLPGGPVEDYNIQQKFDAISLAWTAGTYDPWHAAALANTWTNVGGGYGAAAYSKDVAGVVRIRGFVTGGTLNSVIFTLPVGYRIAAHEIFAQYQNGVFCAVQVLSTGGVQQIAGAANVNVSIGCSFRTEA